MENHNDLKWDEAGLLPAIIQDFSSNEILMLGWMNKDSLEETIKTNKTCFWSRSRQKIWRKGETSGNIQEVKNIKIDCDRDTIIIKVNSKGPACHTGEDSCFFNNI